MRRRRNSRSGMVNGDFGGRTTHAHRMHIPCTKDLAAPNWLTPGRRGADGRRSGRGKSGGRVAAQGRPGGRDGQRRPRGAGPVAGITADGRLYPEELLAPAQCRCVLSDLTVGKSDRGRPSGGWPRFTRPPGRPRPDAALRSRPRAPSPPRSRAPANGPGNAVRFLVGPGLAGRGPLRSEELGRGTASGVGEARFTPRGRPRR